MAELVLELLSEEIPARMQQPMAEQLKQAVAARLDKDSLYHSRIETYVTPRRLVLSIDGLSLTQENTMTEQRGPRVDAPQQAIDGFVRSTGLKLEQLTRKKTDKGEFFFAIKEQRGVPTNVALTKALEDILPTLRWPKSMRWGDQPTRWVRPLKNVMAVFGGETLPLCFGHLESNNLSQGHRFLSKGEFPVEQFTAYKETLRERYVVLSSDDRKKAILEQIEAVIQDKSLTLVQDDALLDEVAGLVEWPNVLLGRIDERYMKVPEEVLISSIRTHQKYFCLRSNDGTLAPYFLVVSNMQTKDGNAQIVAGNERVLRARLADAVFFWQQDRKTPLEERVEDLKKVVFHAKLGTLHEKTERIQALAKYLAVWVPHANLDAVERAGLLCKADLTTEMVGEFPELQGVMGCYYAQHGNEPEEVAAAVRDHYLPNGLDSVVPTDPVSVSISLADKIDTLCGLFTINEKPTGSKDPFALRRASLGVIRMILENHLSVPLRLLLEKSLKLYPTAFFKHAGETPEEEEEKTSLLSKIKGHKAVKPGDVLLELLEFFAERLKALLKADNIRHDLINAVFDGGNEDDLLRIVQRVAALHHFLGTEDGENLLGAYRRATNIVRIEEKNDDTVYKGNPSKSLLEQSEEQELFNILHDLKPQIKKALKENHFEEAMGLLSGARQPIDAFFEAVTVNCDKVDVRKNRLKLLAQLRDLVDDIANFSLIEG